MACQDVLVIKQGDGSFIDRNALMKEGVMAFPIQKNRNVTSLKGRIETRSDRG